MTARNDVLLTLAQVNAWQKEKDDLEREIREKSETLRKIKIKLEAAEVFATESAQPLATNGHAEPAPEPATPREEAEEAEDGESIANVFCADMRATGASLKVAQVRKRLEELGFGDTLRKKPNYVYGFVYRLTKSGKLLKRGMRYRAAQTGSSQEEPEAVGASGSH
jgi:hypothetical protein